MADRLIHSHNNGFDGLPPELISAIAEHLETQDLLTLRKCGNEAIRAGIDFMFVSSS